MCAANGLIAGREAVVALGPWAGDAMAALGRPVPMGVKRGYHMHYKTRGNAVLNRPVIDSEIGYALAPMTQGIRLMTGAEFALRDSAPTPVQLDRVEPAAQGLFPLAERAKAEPWLGRRPCMPDMLPVIGPVAGLKGLWVDFGHHHLGFTLGPVTGRLLAEMMIGETPFTDPMPYRIERFLRGGRGSGYRSVGMEKKNFSLIKSALICFFTWAATTTQIIRACAHREILLQCKTQSLSAMADIEQAALVRFDLMSKRPSNLPRIG